MRITAAVLHEQGLPTPFAQSEPFRVEEVELEGPGADEVLVEVRAAGLCHSDLSVVEGLRQRALPTVGGHEGAGIVREVGRDVRGFVAGDHVAMSAVAGCGRCRACRGGRPGLCKALAPARAEGLLPTGARRLRLSNGDRLNHFSGISAFAQYAVVAHQSLVKIDRQVPFEIAALFGCAVITGAGAVFNSAKVQPGSVVAIIGLGGVGLTAVMAAREARAARVIGIDVLAEKFGLARSVGATDCFDARDPALVEQLLDLTDGGVDHAFESSGHPAAVETAKAITAPGGEVIGIGLGATTSAFSVAQVPWVVEERVYRGSFMGGGSPEADIPKYVDMYLHNRLPVDRLLSERIEFGQLNAGFDRLQGGSVVRQILLPHGMAP